MSHAVALAALLVALAAANANAQDWRTSGEDPCACTDSMPYVIGPRPPVDTDAGVLQMVRDSRNESYRVSRLAVETLRSTTDPRATAALVDALRSTACAIRSSAAYSLERHRGDAIAPALVPLLSDPDRRVRQAGAYAWGRQPQRSALPTMVALLSDPSKHVRLAAVESLGRAGDASVRSAIVPLLTDGEPHVREAAKQALARLPAAR